MIALALAGSVSAPPARASMGLPLFLEWAASCRDRTEAAALERCTAAEYYFLGVVNGVFATEKTRWPGVNPAICRYPADVSGRQMFREFTTYGHRTVRDGGRLPPEAPTARFVLEFLTSERPCPEHRP
jgi:hypothetical protein